ncbi:MAG: SDR family NAD(P)-dependent oxidoreductase [Clostridia bacterium]|nr:SDR family NAD(P)-dependent oxidoreductase [Clostridia bacterium]
MKTEVWLQQNTAPLVGKTVAVTGTTGGLGRELCRHLAGLGASLILLDRNAERSERFREELMREYPAALVRCIGVDLESLASVKVACETLKAEPIDVLIHNAGAYSIPRHKCETGLDNVFQINFASPYYMIRELLPTLRERGGRVVAVGSIAHNYSKSDPNDVDFSTRRQASKVYGNAKRYLMFSLCELFRQEDRVTLALTHPGISFTNITAHYPKLIFAIIKHPMKVIFMKPCRACLSILRGVFEPCGAYEWIGPRSFDVWGIPKKKRLKTCTPDEGRQIARTAEQIYRQMKEQP